MPPCKVWHRQRRWTLPGPYSASEASRTCFCAALADSGQQQRPLAKNATEKFLKRDLFLLARVHFPSVKLGDSLCESSLNLCDILLKRDRCLRRRHHPHPHPWYRLFLKLRLETALTTTKLPRIPSAQMAPYMKMVRPSGKADRKEGRRTGEPRSMADPALQTERRRRRELKLCADRADVIPIQGGPSGCTLRSVDIKWRVAFLV